MNKTTGFIRNFRSLIPTSLIRLHRKSKYKKLVPGAKKLHLGCGGNLLPDWSNIDFDGPAGIIEHNLTKPFPLPSDSVKFIFSEHFIEHITRDEALALLKECYRVLMPEGVIRMSTPSLKKLLEEYSAERTTEWTDMDWCPATPCRMVNEGMRLWGHQFVYDFEEFTLILNEAGFNQVTKVQWRKSSYPELEELECRPFHDEIIVEAVK